MTLGTTFVVVVLNGHGDEPSPAELDRSRRLVAVTLGTISVVVLNGHGDEPSPAELDRSRRPGKPCRT